MPKTRLDDSIERFPTQARFTPLSCPHCLWSQEGYRARRGGEHLQQGGGPGGGSSGRARSNLGVCFSFLAVLETCQCFPLETFGNAPFPPLFSTVYLPKPLFFFEPLSATCPSFCYNPGSLSKQSQLNQSFAA